MSEKSACGVLFRHNWHGYLDDDGRMRVCDGELLPTDSGDSHE